MSNDPDLVARKSAEAMWADDRASQHLGMSIADVGRGRAELRMTVSEMMINGHGIAHGGYVFMLADSAFAFACNSHGKPTVASGCDIDFVAPSRLGDELIAVAEERVLAGRSGVYDVTVRRADGTIVAVMRGRSRTVGGSAYPGR